MQGSRTDPGIIHRVLEALIGRLEQSGNRWQIACSLIEIYNEKVYDLSTGTTDELPIREDANRNILIPNLVTHRVSCVRDFEAFYGNTMQQRRTAITKLNTKSSRSHCCLMVEVSEGNGDR